MIEARYQLVLYQNQTGYFVFQWLLYPIAYGSIYHMHYQVFIIFVFDSTFLSLLLSEAGKFSTLREFQNKTASVILSSLPNVVYRL